MRLGATFGFAAALVAPPSAVATALVTQHVFGMQPCPWCVLQRLILVTVALAALPGVFWRGTAVRRASAALIVVLSACGMAAALWQHFVAAASASCNLTLADRIVSGTGLDSLWPAVFAAYASCADAAARLFGVPYEFYSLTVFALLLLCAAALFRRPLA